MYVRFIIERDRMYTENANRARSDGNVTENYSPESKNPIIAAFFRNIGLADELGSGTRRLNKYVPLYSGALPEMHEGDVFRTIIPLDDNYSYSVGKTKKQNVKEPISIDWQSIGNRLGESVGTSVNKQLIVSYIKENGECASAVLSEITGLSQIRVRVLLQELAEDNALIKVGNYRYTTYILSDKLNGNR